VVPNTTYPLPNEEGQMEHNWLVHQLHTTANFAQYNKAFTWFVGGLNHQVEHHLFPNICHVHYPKITKIIQDTAKEFNLPHHSFPTFGNALTNHIQLLKQFGQ
jgi:linoleoyl-CoA desaturase